MSNNLEKVEIIQKVAELSMQGYKETYIAGQLNISVGTVKNYLREWENFIKSKAEKNPDLLDKVLENTVSFMENFDFILKEAWEVYNDAKEFGVAATRLQALKLINELTSQKARLVQLLGQKTDTRISERARRAERVNTMLSEAIKNVISDCDHCGPILWEELKSIFMSDEKSSGGEVYELESGSPEEGEGGAILVQD